MRGASRASKKKRLRDFNSNGGNNSGFGFNDDNVTEPDNEARSARTGPRNDNNDQPDNVLIVLNNCRGYRSKSASIREMIHALNPDCLLLQETFLKDRERIRIKNFLSYHRNREGAGGGGGIATLISDRISQQSAAIATGRGKSELLTTRLGHTNPAISIIQYYGCQESDKSEVEAGWEQVLTAVAQANARGDHVLLCGDFNRKVGRAAGGDDDRVSVGGRKVLDLIESEGMLLVNGMFDKVAGGPGTRQDPADPLKTSVLSLVIASPSLLPYIDKLIIDSERKHTPRRVRRGVDGLKVTYSDHFLIELHLKNLKSVPKRTVVKDWFFSRPNAWPKYKEASSEAAAKIQKAIDVTDDVNSLDRKINKISTALLWKIFGKKTKKVYGGEREKSDRLALDNKKVSRSNLMKFEVEMDRLSLQNSRLGKIWELRSILFGNKKCNSDPPSAVFKPGTETLVCTTEGIKDITCEHVKETLKDCEPLPEFAGIILERNLKHFRFMSDNKNLRLNLPKQVFDQVLFRMRLNNKSCYKLVTKGSDDYADSLYRFFVKIIEDESIPVSFSDTTLTQLFKKGNPADLGNWRFIHMKPAVPRLFEACVTEMLKPKLLKSVSPFQLGGISGNQPAQHCYTLKTVLAARNVAKIPSFISIFDMKKFFDKEAALDVCMTMNEVGINGPEYRMFYKLVEFNNLKIKTPAGTTKSFHVGPIIPQGSSFGAIVSSINLDRAVYKAFSNILGVISAELGVKMRPLLFQDDILKVNKTKTEAQISQKVIYDTVSSKTLEFNLTKCSVIIHGNGMRSKLERSVYDSDPVMTGPAATPLTAKDKYLGDVIHESDLNNCYRETVKARLPRVRGAVSELMAVVEDIKASNLHPIAVGLDLWNKVVLPMLLYNSNTWIQIKEKDYGVIEKVQFDFLRRLLRAPAHTLRAGLLWETGQWPMRMRIMMSKIMLFRHLTNLPVSSLARQVFDAESLEVGGLKLEVMLFCQSHGIALPTAGSDKDEFRKKLKSKLDAIVANELRAKLIASANMAGTETEKFEAKSYLMQGSLGHARQMFSYRAGTTSELVGNCYGTQVSRVCLCSKGYETSSHIPRCALYEDCDAGLADRISNFSECMIFWDRVLKRKKELQLSLSRPVLGSIDTDRGSSSSSPDSSQSSTKSSLG